MLSSLDDAGLLREVLTRSEPAWTELLRRYRFVIERTIAKALKHHVDAADDVFGDFCALLLERDMRKLRAWDPARGARLSTWLCLLAIHAARDRLLTLRRNGRIGDDAYLVLEEELDWAELNATPRGEA